MLTREQVKALDDWRFLRRMPSRAAAVRELLKRGLAAEGFETASDRMASKEFGVLDGLVNETPANPPRARNGKPAS